MWPINSLILWHRVLVTALFATQGPGPFVVVLDPGHGGTERGACRPGTRICEKDLTLRVAKQAARILSRTGDILVILTRKEDRHVPLYDRVALAGRVGADLLVSIHANASPRRNQTGYEIYVYPNEPRFGEPSMGGPTQDPSWTTQAIVADLRRQALGRCSRSFGSLLRRQVRRRLGKQGDRGLLTAEMAVLAGASTPSVLFEMGFIDHRREGSRLEDPAYQRRIVSALVTSIRRWAHRATNLGCRSKELSGNRKTDSARKPRLPKSQGRGRTVPSMLRKTMPRVETRQLVVSADPTWTRQETP